MLGSCIGELSALYAFGRRGLCGRRPRTTWWTQYYRPTQHGVAIVTGTHTENFRDIVGLFQRRDAVRIVSLSELPLTLMHLLADERRAKSAWSPCERDDPLPDGRHISNVRGDPGIAIARERGAQRVRCAQRVEPWQRRGRLSLELVISSTITVFCPSASCKGP